MARLMLNGKVPTKDELMTDDLVKQMVDDAKAEGVKSVSAGPDKATIIQSLTADEVKDLAPVKQMIETAKAEGTKAEEVLQNAKKEDLEKLPVVQDMIAESLRSAKFTEKIIQAVKSDGNAITSGDGGVGGAPESETMKAYKKLGSR